MKNQTVFFLLILLASAFVSCEKNDCPYQDERFCDQAYRDSLANINPDSTDTLSETYVEYPASVYQNHLKNGMLEYFTGFRCQNCPPASATANNLKTQLGERLVLVFVHATPQFAAPINPAPEIYSTDFRTAQGEQYISAFQISGLPNGTVNRRNFGNGIVVPAGDWSSRLEDELAESPQAFLEIRSITLSENSAMMTVQMAVKPLVNLTGSYNLSVGITESGIIEGQKNGSIDVYPYTHNHVFRGNVNGLYGQTVLTGNEVLTASQSLLFNFDVAVQENWIIANCKVFAYLHDTDSREIIQSTERKVLD